MIRVISGCIPTWPRDGGGLLRSKIAIEVLLFGGVFIVLAAAQQQPARSQIIIHVHKAGLLSAFGHDHTVVAPISQAVINVKNRSVEITVPAKQMKVTDKEVSDSDRAEIQSTMLGPKVLDTDKYAEVRFKSIRVEPAGSQHFRVMGILSLHGVSQEISFE